MNSMSIYFQTPTDTATWENIIRGFESRWNFPNCIGGLEGKHVHIHCPANSGSTYFNYKRSFSIVLMALVDSNYMFTYLDVGTEGRVADGGIWRSCSLHKRLRSGQLNLPPHKTWPNGDEFGPQPNVIVADDAFALASYLMKPYNTREMSREKRIFNYRYEYYINFYKFCYHESQNNYKENKKGSNVGFQKHN